MVEAPIAEANSIITESSSVMVYVLLEKVTVLLSASPAAIPVPKFENSKNMVSLPSVILSSTKAGIVIVKAVAEVPS